MVFSVFSVISWSSSWKSEEEAIKKLDVFTAYVWPEFGYSSGDVKKVLVAIKGDKVFLWFYFSLF